MKKDNTKGIITAIKAYIKRFNIDTEPYCAQISKDGDKFKLITPELSMILKDNVLLYDNDIILNAEIPFQRYHFKTMFPVTNTNKVMYDTNLLADKVRKLEKTKKQFDNENQYFRFIDFDPIIQEFTTAHKENNRKYIRVNSNSVKTALRIVKMCGDNRVKLCYDKVAFYKYPLLMFFEHGLFIIKNEGNEL